MADISPTQKQINRLILKHSLRSIEFMATERTVLAKAIPQAYHKAVSDRRQEELTNAAIASGGSLSIAEATKITEDAATTPLAKGYGASLEDALFDLERALKAL